MRHNINWENVDEEKGETRNSCPPYQSDINARHRYSRWFILSCHGSQWISELGSGSMKFRWQSTIRSKTPRTDNQVWIRLSINSKMCGPSNGRRRGKDAFLLERNYPSWCHNSVKNGSLTRGKLHCHARCKLYLSFLSPDGRWNIVIVICAIRRRDEKVRLYINKNLDWWL